MARTYDPSLETDKDWVRFLAGDRDIVRAVAQDEEIYATLREEPNKYLAAALICELILAKTQGVVDKQVGDLRLKFSDNPKSGYQEHIRRLRERGAELTIQIPRTFRTL